MPNRSPEDSGAGLPGRVETQTPLISQDYTATIASASLLVALIALVISILSFRRSKRIERDSRFESAYGSQLRSELRKFEEALLKFRAYTFPAGKTVVELKVEFEELRVELEEATRRVACLLGEMDKATSVNHSNWATTLTNHTAQAELLMQATAHNSVATELDFRTRVEDARASYQSAIDAVRRKLDNERTKV